MKNPIEAIEQYDFTCCYKVSPDKHTFYAINREGKIEFGYFLSRYIQFSPDYTDYICGIPSTPISHFLKIH